MSSRSSYENNPKLFPAGPYVPSGRSNLLNGQDYDLVLSGTNLVLLGNEGDIDLVDISGLIILSDQTIPQTINGGLPLLNVELSAFNNEKQLTNKEYVDSEIIIIKNVVTDITTTSATLEATNGAIVVDDDTAGSTVTINLPPASGNRDLQFSIKKIGTTANVVIKGDETETIDGSNTATLTTQYESITIICDGTSWNII